VDPFIGYRNLPTPMSPGTPMVLPKALQWPEFARNPTPSLGEGYGGPSYGADTRASRVVKGTGNVYVYRQYSDGAIRIISKAGQAHNVYLKPNSGAPWEAITRDIGAYPVGGRNPIADIVNAFRSGGKQAGTVTAVNASVLYGPGIVDAAKTYLDGRADDVPALQRRLAYYRTYHAQASGQRKERLGFQIKMLETRLDALRVDPTEQAVADDPAQPGDTQKKADKIPKWLPYAALGIGAAGLFITLYARTR
jgi:hypothetical protein